MPDNASLAAAFRVALSSDPPHDLPYGEELLIASDLFLAAVTELIDGKPAPVSYTQDLTGDFSPTDPDGNWLGEEGMLGAPCAPG